MSKYITLLSLLFQLAFVSAATVTLVEPVQQVAGDSAIHLGVVGPGQTMELKFSRDTGVPAAINPTTGKNALWDQASIVRSTLPNEWSSRDSLKYENPLTVYVTVSPDAEAGGYSFTVAFTDEYEGTQPVTADFTVTVDPSSIFEVGLVEETASAGVGQPAVFKLIARNRGIASDTFMIKASGLPYDWQFSKTFFLPHGQEKDVYFEVVGNIQKEVPFTINVTSLSSGKITHTLTAKVVTQNTLLQEAKSTTLGLPLFPTVEQHVYALIGLVVNTLFK